MLDKLLYRLPFAISSVAIVFMGLALETMHLAYIKDAFFCLLMAIIAFIVYVCVDTW